MAEQESSATLLSLAPESLNSDPMVELAYDEGGSGWWPLSTLVFQQRLGRRASTRPHQLLPQSLKSLLLGPLH